MTAFLPPNLLALFAPREPLPYIPPLQELPWEKKPWPYTGVASYLSSFEDCSETPAPTRAETREERQMRKTKEREERHKDKLEKDLSEWDPATDPNIEGDPYKTLFVGRVNFDTSESKLRREFESFGPIKKISMVTNSNSGKPRGYAFIEYEHERDQRSAYKYADGKKIDNKRVVVDIERGRTVKNWKPRRLGGGLGGTRKGAPHECIKYSGRVDERDRRESERDKDRDRDRDRDSDRRREKDRERGDRDRDRDRDRSDRDKGDRDRDRSDRDRDRGDRDRDRDRTRDKERKRERERSRSRDKKRKRSRSRDRSDRGEKRKDKDRDRESRHKEKKEKDRTNGVKEEPMEAA